MKTVRRQSLQGRVKGRTQWGCPLTKNRSCWCYALCTPRNGIGDCGRPAGHATLSRTQRAILAHKTRSASE